MKTGILLWLLLLNLSVSLGQKVQFFGLGRAVVSREKLQGRITETDTTNPQQGMGGYTLLDMGIKYQPFHHFRTRGIVRIKNQFGMFWGEGTSLIVREIRLEGTAAKIINFEVGDIDMQFSPFTLSVPDMYPEELPAIFNIRRKIQEYESFVSDHQRRLQGLTLFNSLQSRNENHKLKSRLLFARSLPSIITGESNILAGGNVKYSRKEMLSFQLNAISHFPLKTIKPQIFNYVVSLDYLFVRPISEKSKLHWNGEIGTSQQEVIAKNNKSQLTAGLASFLKMKWLYKNWLEISLAHLTVTPSFYSPGSQSSLYNYYQPPAVFPTYGNVPLYRSTTLFDHLTQEDILDRSIRNYLYPYFPNLNNIFPYGIASPNRAGFFANTTLRNNQGSLEVKAECFTGSELEPEESNQKRNFLQWSGSLSFHFHKLAGWSKQVNFTGSIRHQQTTRASVIDSLRINLSTSFVSGGVEIELAPQFFVLAGVAANTAIGNERMPLRSIINEIYQFKKENWQERQWFLSSGLQYKFGSASFFTFHFNSFAFWDKKEQNRWMQIGQGYLNFTLGF